MSLSVRAIRNAVLCGILVLPACVTAASAGPTGLARSGMLHTLARGGPGGGGGGPGTIPPPSLVDGPAWFINNGSSVTTPSPNINFDALQNNVQGGISIGATRTAMEIVYNISKKTSLTLTGVSIVGANPGDFSLTPAYVQNALNVPIRAQQGAGFGLQVVFSPLAAGARSATLRLVSNAGTALISLTGTALPARPIISTSSAFSFLPASAPATLIVTNNGGQALVLQSFTFGGANPGSFALTAANSGQSNCFAGAFLGPHSYCFLAVGLAPGARAPASAFLAIRSNDPVTPTKDIQLTLTP